MFKWSQDAIDAKAYDDGGSLGLIAALRNVR